MVSALVSDIDEPNHSDTTVVKKHEKKRMAAQRVKKSRFAINDMLQEIKEAGI